MHFFVLKICTYQKKVVPLQRKTKNKTTTKNKNIMKKYLINKIQNRDVIIIAKSINDLEKQVIAYCDMHFGGVTKIYVHCSHILSTNVDEQNIAYLVRVNNQARTITTRRL